MGLSSRDSNFVPTFTAVLNTDGATVIAVKVGSTTRGIKAKDGTTGTDNGPKVALRDVNNVHSLLAVSSTDGTTPVTLYADSSGNLLIQTS